MNSAIKITIEREGSVPGKLIFIPSHSIFALALQRAIDSENFFFTIFLLNGNSIELLVTKECATEGWVEDILSGHAFQHPVYEITNSHYIECEFLPPEKFRE